AASRRRGGPPPPPDGLQKWAGAPPPPPAFARIAPSHLPGAKTPPPHAAIHLHDPDVAAAREEERPLPVLLDELPPAALLPGHGRHDMLEHLVETVVDGIHLGGVLPD